MVISEYLARSGVLYSLPPEAPYPLPPGAGQGLAWAGAPPGPEPGGVRGGADLQRDRSLLFYAKAGRVFDMHDEVLLAATGSGRAPLPTPLVTATEEDGGGGGPSGGAGLRRRARATGGADDTTA